MTREKFLTARWNNWLTLAMGLPFLIFGIVFFSTDAMSDFSGFVALFVAGAVYWTVVENHSARRSVWQRETVGGPKPDRLRGTRRFIFFVYNIVYWAPILAFTPIMDHRTGFIAFFWIVIIRAIVNAYRNNFLTLEQGERFPLRVPWRPGQVLSRELNTMLCYLGKGLFFLSRKAMERFSNPRNVGVIEDPDGFGHVGDPSYGFDLELYIKVRDNAITDARFKAFGCAATIATVSMVSEMLEGRSIEQALDISGEEIAEALDGLPPSRMHSAELGRELIRSAVDDFIHRRID